MASPNLRTHRLIDPSRGKLFGHLTPVPKSLVLWLGWWRNRQPRADPHVAPVHGERLRLPPTPVQASEAERLRYDACRCVNRASAAGSPVRLPTWFQRAPAWPRCHAELPAGAQALDAPHLFIIHTEHSQAAGAPANLTEEFA